MSGGILRGARWLPAAVLAGCWSTPPFEPEGGVTYTESKAGAGGATVEGTGFALRFADGAGFHFPDSLLIDGVEVIGSDPAKRCLDEDEVGLRITPFPRVSAHGPAAPVANQLTPVLRGPGVVQARLDWSTRFPCNANRNPGGTSTFTVFPDGRIVRFDKFTDTSTSEVSGATCTCDPQAPGEDILFTLSTFWTLARDRFTRFFRVDMPGEMPLPERNDNVINNVPVSCVDAGGFQVAFGWVQPQGRGAEIRGGDKGIVFGFEFAFRDSILSSFEYESSSALLVERRGCTEGFARANEHVTPSVLKVNGQAVTLSPRDGIYGGDLGTGAMGVDLPSDGRATITGPVTVPYAVLVRFPRATGAVRAKRQGASGAWYIPQRVDDRSWIFWFKDPLQMNQEIVIEPR